MTRKTQVRRCASTSISALRSDPLRWANSQSEWLAPLQISWVLVSPAPQNRRNKMALCYHGKIQRRCFSSRSRAHAGQNGKPITSTDMPSFSSSSSNQDVGSHADVHKIAQVSQNGCDDMFDAQPSHVQQRCTNTPLKRGSTYITPKLLRISESSLRLRKHMHNTQFLKLDASTCLRGSPLQRLTDLLQRHTHTHPLTQVKQRHGTEWTCDQTLISTPHLEETKHASGLRNLHRNSKQVM